MYCNASCAKWEVCMLLHEIRPSVHSTPPRNSNLLHCNDLLSPLHCHFVPLSWIIPTNVPMFLNISHLKNTTSLDPTSFSSNHPFLCLPLHRTLKTLSPLLWFLTLLSLWNLLQAAFCTFHVIETTLTHVTSYLLIAKLKVSFQSDCLTAFNTTACSLFRKLLSLHGFVTYVRFSTYLSALSQHLLLDPLPLPRFWILCASQLSPNSALLAIFTP